MARSDRLRVSDIRAVFRLIGECRERGADPVEWRRHMLEGLRRLTGAQLARYLHIYDPGTDIERIAEPLDSGFLDDSNRALWWHYQRVNTPREDRITSSVQLPATSPRATQVIVLHRAAAYGPYPQHAKRLVHLFHEELIPLLGRQLTLPGAGDDGPALPFQLRHVLRCLLSGDSEKQVAARLGLSPHTVNKHVQRLYRRFGVHSRGELMFRCRDMLPATPDQESRIGSPDDVTAAATVDISRRERKKAGDMRRGRV